MKVMQRWCAMAVVVLASGATTQTSAGDESLDMVAVGDLPPAMAERVRAFAQENLAMAVRLAEPMEASPAESLNAIGRAALDRLGGADVALVVLAVPAEDHRAHGIMMPDERVAVVNARLLKPEDDDEERYGRRLEREAMMSFGLLIGLETCPNPQCAMWLYSNTEELDLKGRNYCPPCLDRFQKIAMPKGVRVIRESPFAPILEEDPAEAEQAPGDEPPAGGDAAPGEEASATEAAPGDE